MPDDLHGPSRATRWIFWIALSVLTTSSLAATVFDGNRWPISSFNVFSAASTGDVWTMKAILIGRDGRERAYDPGRMLPVEFFKARSMLAEVFLQPRPIEVRDGFAKRMLDRLAHRPWRSFDEVLAPAPGDQVGSLRIELWRLRMSDGGARIELVPVERVAVYSGPPGTGR